MSDLLSALVPVIDAFESLGVQYRIGGSVASSALGVARTTMDVDLVTDLALPQAAPLVLRLRGPYYVDQKMIEEAIRIRSSFNLIHLDTMVKIDVFMVKSRAYDRAAFARCRDQSFSPERDFHVQTPEDVILCKLEWFRMGGEVSERQWRDIQGVLRVQRQLDRAWLASWAEAIGVSDLLERALSEAKETPG